MKKTRMLAVVALGLLVTACDRGAGTPMTPSPSPQARVDDPKVLALGKEVFMTHCARCHGQQAEGAPDWRTPNAQGHYPPPPLNGSGHAWHHPKAMLRQVIREGSPPGPQARMPAWKDRLSEQEIQAVIAWFQSLWPEDVYQAWQQMDRRGGHRNQ